MAPRVFRVAVLSLLLVATGGIAEDRNITLSKACDFDGKRFRSPEPLNMPFKVWLKRSLSRNRGPWRKFTPNAEVACPVASVDGGRIHVTFVNHATLLVQMDGLNILTDPTWAERSVPSVGPRRRRPAGIPFEDLPPIDVAVVSHDHHDHMDFPTLRRLKSTFKTQVIAGAGSKELLARRGISGARDLQWWESTQVAPGVTITAVPARHQSGRSLFDKYHRLWCGFVISGPSGVVYFAGDTGMGSHFEEIARRFGPIRLALLPIGGATPEWFQAEQHIGPVEAVQASRILRAGTTIPMHFGTFPQSDDSELGPVELLRSTLEKAGSACPRYVILDNGEATDVPAAGEPRLPAVQTAQSVTNSTLQ